MQYKKPRKQFHFKPNTCIQLEAELGWEIFRWLGDFFKVRPIMLIKKWDETWGKLKTTWDRIVLIYLVSDHRSLSSSQAKPNQWNVLNRCISLHNRNAHIYSSYCTIMLRLPQFFQQNHVTNLYPSFNHWIEVLQKWSLSLSPGFI